jgi:beta-lactamase superfamily II metal-dependent hydrolase
VLDDKTDLDILADSKTETDPSPTNGSSIVLLLRYHGRSMLVTGDAFGADVVDGVRALSPHEPLVVDVCKLPHHGSQYNVTAGLVDAVDAGAWLVSSDGTQFRHPDPPAIARILRAARSRPAHLAFNVPSTFTRWWDDDGWRARFDYTTTYGTKEDGLTLRLL